MAIERAHDDSKRDSRSWIRFNLATLFTVTASIALGLALARYIWLGMEPPLTAICVALFGGPSAVLSLGVSLAAGGHNNAFGFTFIWSASILYGTYAYLLSVKPSRALLVWILGVHALCTILCIPIFWLLLYISIRA
jgi:hypothetical protein